MSIEILEVPLVAHIVADLDEIEAEEATLATFRAACAPRIAALRKPSLLQTLLRSAAAIGVLMFAGACASTGATFHSGVGDAYLERPPYYADVSSAMVGQDTGRIGHLPIAFQRGAAQSRIFDPRDGTASAIDSLLQQMNGFLDSLGVSERLVVHAATSGPPDVQFGCATTSGLAGDDCAERGDSALGRGWQTMRLAVGRPSDAWIDWMHEVMPIKEFSRVLVVTLEVGQYLVKQRGWRGDKEVELGTGHVQGLPWLTSLEAPLTVLQLTGALVNEGGKALRIGAEGIVARRTRLLVSAIGGQELLGENDVTAARSLRRDDLPGQPLAWRVALRELVDQLTG